MNPTKIYNKNLKLFTEGKKIIVNEGGTSSSKTYSILQIILTLMNSPKTKNKTFSVVSESMPHLKKGAMYDFFKILQEDNLYDIKNHNRTDNVYTMGKNNVQFFGVEDDSKVRGPRRDFLFINECNNVPYETFKQLNLRTLNTTWLDFNPVQEFWFHTQLKDRDDVGYVHSTYLDNLEHTPQKIVDDLNRMKELDPNGYKVYALGLVGNLEGIVFNNWCQSNFEMNNDNIVYGLDFGFTNDPSALVSVIKRDQELFVDELLYEVGLTNSDISNRFEQLGLRKHNDIIYCDSAEPKSIEELYRRGWNVKPALKGPDSIMKGIDLLKQYKLTITPRSLNLIKELRSYQWQKDKDGKTINKPIGQDHLIDALRYSISNIDKKTIRNFSLL